MSALSSNEISSMLRAREALTQRIELLENRISMTDANYYKSPISTVTLHYNIKWFTMYRKDNSWELDRDEIDAIRIGYQTKIDELKKMRSDIDHIISKGHDEETEDENRQE